MRRGRVLLSFLLLSCISLIITVALHLINLQLLSSNAYFSATDALFFEGVLFLIFGFLLLIGRGGINLWSVKAAVLSALAGAVYDKDTVGPNEALKRDRWKPVGFTRFALVLLLAGVFMLVIYFITL